MAAVTSTANQVAEQEKCCPAVLGAAVKIQQLAVLFSFVFLWLASSSLAVTFYCKDSNHVELRPFLMISFVV